MTLSLLLPLYAAILAVRSKQALCSHIPPCFYSNEEKSPLKLPHLRRALQFWRAGLQGEAESIWYTSKYGHYRITSMFPLLPCLYHFYVVAVKISSGDFHSWGLHSLLKTSQSGIAPCPSPLRLKKSYMQICHSAEGFYLTSCL